MVQTLSIYKSDIGRESELNGCVSITNLCTKNMILWRNIDTIQKYVNTFCDFSQVFYGRHLSYCVCNTGQLVVPRREMCIVLESYVKK